MNYMKLLLGALFLISVLLLTSCSTALMKTSPFYTGQIIAGKTSSGKVVRWDDPEAVKIEKIFAHDIKATMDDDRIYVWPIFYKNFLMYSLLWPLAEINDVGWEVRPLVSVDNYEQDYRILTGGWNSKDGSNYILPFYVKNDNQFLSLPYSYMKDGNDWIYNYFLLSGYFSEDNSSYLFPLYYYDGGDSTLYTLLFSFAEDEGYIFPVYFYDIHTNDGTTYRKHNILPPFGKYSSKSTDEESYCEEARFFPLFFYDRNERTDYLKNSKYEGQEFDYNKRPDDYYIQYKSTDKSFFMLPWIYFQNNDKYPINESIVFPVYFAGENKFGSQDKEWFHLFPIYFSGYDKSYQGEKFARDQEWKASFPFFIYRRDKEDYYRNFMLLAGNKQKMINEKPYFSSYILPFYFYSYDPVVKRRVNPKYKGKRFSYEDRPEDYYLEDETVKKDSFYFPSLFMTEYENKEYDSLALFPFYFQGYDKRWKKDQEWTTVFPFYFYNRNKEDVYKNYCIFAGTRDEKLHGEMYSSSYIFPFYNYDYKEIFSRYENPKYKDSDIRMDKLPDDYYIKKKTIAKENFYFPSVFTEKYENGDYDSLSVFPFYYTGYDKRRLEDKEWDAYFPVYHYKRDKKDISNNYFCFTGTESTHINDKEYNSSYCLPLYYYGYSKDVDYVKNPKYKDKNIVYKKRPKDYYQEKETARKKTYVFPNYYAEENKKKGESEFTIFPFVFHEENKNYIETGTPFSFYHRKEYLNNDNLSSQLLWFLYYYDRNSYSETEYIFPSYYSYTKRNKNHTITNFFPFTFHEKTEYLDSFGTFLWLYTSRDYLKEKKSEKQAFWYLYYNEQYEADGTVRKEPYESSRILWKAYHRETKGDVTNIDAFPFLSYSKNNKRTKFSFAYRLFSVEKAKESTKVHLLFIPVWW